MREKQVAKFTAYKNRKLIIHFDKTVVVSINLKVFAYFGWIANEKEAKEAFTTLKTETIQNLLAQ